MIANADKFTYCGYVITQFHVMYVFKEGVLIEKLSDQLCDPPAGVKPTPWKVGKDMIGWHPLGPSDRWDHIDYRTWFQRSDTAENLRQLRADWVAHKIPNASSPAAFALAHHVAGVPVMRIWNTAMVPTDPRQPEAPYGRSQAVARLRFSEVAPAADTLPMGSALARSQPWRRLESATVSAILFSTGLYISRHPDAQRQGFHPVAGLFTHLNDQGAQALRSNAGLVSEMDNNGCFMMGQYDAPEGSGHCAWFGVNDRGDIVDHEVFDAPLLPFDDPHLKPSMTREAALQLLLHGRFAPRWHPLRLDQVDQLGHVGAWGCCGFVAAIQAAVYTLGRHDLLKPDAYSTLTPVIEAFFNAHPTLVPQALGTHSLVTPEDFMQMVRNDQAMRCSSIDLGVTQDMLVALMTSLGLQPRSSDMQELPLTPENLPKANAIYGVDRPDKNGHWVYVTPASEHLLWGPALHADAAAAELGRRYTTIFMIHQLG